MANEIRQQEADIKTYLPELLQGLLSNPQTFSFNQAVRLLNLLHSNNYNNLDDFLQNGLKISPHLSLAHPSSDMVNVSDAGAYYHIIVTFLSLYGAASPLPTFYTEELLEEAGLDESVSRDFLDIFNQVLYTAYYKAYNSSKIAMQTIEFKDEKNLELQYSLLGFGEKKLRQHAKIDYNDLKFINLFSKYATSSHNIEEFLSAKLNVDVSLEECVKRTVEIPLWQRSRLGDTILGENVIGKSVYDYEGKFTIHINNLDYDEMLLFQPKAQKRLLLEKSLNKILRIPLEYNIVLHNKENSLPVACLYNQNDTSQKSSRLGSCFLNSKDVKATNYYV